MKDTKDILEQPSLHQAPYTVPEGYFASVEESVRARITAPSKRPGLWTVLKPGIAVACMFLFIFGIGYGTLSLTGTLDSGRSTLLTAESGTERSLSEENLDEAIEAMPDEELMQYLSERVSWTDLQLFLADNY